MDEEIAWSIQTSTYQYILGCNMLLLLQGWRLLHFGRGKPGPRLGGLTIEETSDDMQDSACKTSDKRWKETREGRKGDRAWLEMKCECDLCTGTHHVHTCMY